MTDDIYQPHAYFDKKYTNGSPMLTCARDLQALELLRADLHAEFPNDYANPLFIYQGAFHDGDKSASTHLGSSVYDLHPSDFEAKARLGAKHGIIVFHRPFNWDGTGGGAHLHCIVRGGRQMNPAAVAQVRDWDQHLNGLASHTKYDTGPDFPWFPVKAFTYHKPLPPPKKPEFPDVSEAIGVLGTYHATGWAIEQDLTVKAHAHPGVQPLQEALGAVTAALPPIRDARTALVHWRNQQGG